MPCVWDPRRSRGGTGGGADALLYTVQDPRRSSGGGAGADALPSFQWEGTDACQGDLNGG